MSAARPTFRRDVELGITAYRLCNVNLRPRVADNPAAQHRLVTLVRRLRASDYDVEDCLIASDGIAYRRELRCVARALRGLIERQEDAS